jgi:hypothetical protein
MVLGHGVSAFLQRAQEAEYGIASSGFAHCVRNRTADGNARAFGDAIAREIILAQPQAFGYRCGEHNAVTQTFSDCFTDAEAHNRADREADGPADRCANNPPDNSAYVRTAAKENGRAARSRTGGCG